MTPQHLTAYKRLARKYGFRYVILPMRPDVCWDGSGNLYLWDMDDNLVPHDLGHYLVATPPERKMLEFGLGRSPGSLYGEIEGTTLRGPFTVERQASLLGIFLQMKIEDRKAAAQTYRDHAWVLRGALDTARILVKKGFLVWSKGRLVPRAIVREPKKKDVFR